MHYTEEQKNALPGLYEKIKGIRIAMLTTIDRATGQLHSRPMATHDTDADGSLWFFTYSNSEKADEVQHHPEVNLTYCDTGDDRYISISGDAEMVNDKQKMEKLWNPALKIWFPDGLDNPKMSLLKVKIRQAEYWDGSKSMMVKLLEYAKSAIMGKTPEPGEHKKVDMGKAY